MINILEIEDLKVSHFTLIAIRCGLRLLDSVTLHDKIKECGQVTS